MFMVPKEIYSRVISNLSSDQIRRVDEINVDQVNVACGPLFAGLKKGKKFGQKRTREKEENSRHSDIEEDNLRNHFPEKFETKAKAKTKTNPAPKKRSNNRKTAGEKKSSKTLSSVKKSAVRERSIVKNAEVLPIKVKKNGRKAKNAIALEYPPQDSSHAHVTKRIVTRKDDIYQEPKNASPVKGTRKASILKRPNRESAESAVWGDILSPSQKRDKESREKNVSRAWRNRRVLGLSDIHSIQQEREANKRRRTGREPLNSTALGGEKIMNATVTSDSIFDKSTVLVPPQTPVRNEKSAEKTIERIISPQKTGEEYYGDISRLFGEDFRGEPEKSAETSINEDIMDRLSAPENAQETMEIQRALELGTPRSVRKLSERFLTPAKSAKKTPEKLMTPQGLSLSPESVMNSAMKYPETPPPPPIDIGMDLGQAFGRSKKMARSPVAKAIGGLSSFYGSVSPPMKKGALGEKDNVTTRLSKSQLAKKERDRKRKMGIDVPTPKKVKKSLQV